jgi:hypothetical protein
MAMTETMETATEIRRLQPKDAALYRELRLEALLRSPEAFSSIFEGELLRRWHGLPIALLGQQSLARSRAPNSSASPASTSLRLARMSGSKW